MSYSEFPSDFSGTRPYINSLASEFGKENPQYKLTFGPILDKTLVDESQIHRSSSHFFAGMGLGAGIVGGSLLGGAASIGGIFAAVGGTVAFGLSTAGVGFAVIGAIFLLIALIEYVRSRKAENREIADRPIVSIIDVPSEWPEIQTDGALIDEELQTAEDLPDELLYLINNEIEEDKLKKIEEDKLKKTEEELKKIEEDGIEEWT